jgi:predicted O-methyltransferase YrrM
MNALLEDLFKTKKFRNSSNEIIDINSETSRGQCEYLQSLIRENGFTDSLEIGFAYGMSTLAIVEEIAKRNGHHTVIDKFQIADWGGNGLDLVKQAGYGPNLTFIEKYCYEVLPELMQNGRKIDFAYIDSTKQFDWLLVDFFYIDKLMKVGGIVVFDDVAFPSIRKLLRYLSGFPGYIVHSQFPASVPPSAFRKLAGLLKILPKAKRLFRPEIFVTDHELGLNAHCIALRNIYEDKRSWDWHTDF